MARNGGNGRDCGASSKADYLRKHNSFHAVSFWLKWRGRGS